MLLVSGLQTVQSPINTMTGPRRLACATSSSGLCQCLGLSANLCMARAHPGGASPSVHNCNLQVLNVAFRHSPNHSAAWCLALIVHSDNERAIACPEQDPVNRARRARKRAQITGLGARSRLTRGAAEELAWRLRGFGGFAQSASGSRVSRRARAHPRAKESRTRYICCTPNVQVEAGG